MLVIALHGHPFDRRMWDPLAQLAREDALGGNVALFAPDFRGRGTSRRPATREHTMALLADDLAADIHELLPADEPLLLAGLSMGGYVLFELLRRHGALLRTRLAAVALLDTKATADDDAGQAKRRGTIAALRERGIEAALETLPKLLSPRSHGTDAESVVATMIRETPVETACADQLGMLERQEGFSVLADLDRPLLLLAGEDDGITPPHDAEAMAEAVTNVPYMRLVTVPEAGHVSPLERPREVAEALADLIARAR